MQESGGAGDGSDGTNAAEGRISSAGRPEVTRRRTGRV